MDSVHLIGTDRGNTRLAGSSLWICHTQKGLDLAYKTCVSEKQIYFGGGVFSQGVQAKTNSTHKGKWTDCLGWGPACILFWNFFNDLSCFHPTYCLWRDWFPPSFKRVSSLYVSPHQHIVYVILGVITDELTFIFELHMLNAAHGPAEERGPFPLYILRT